jgi:hypothetical protein
LQDSTVMHDIERHANDTWKSGKRCQAAYDFLRVNVPIEVLNAPSGPASTRPASTRTSSTSYQNAPQEQTMVGSVKESSESEGRKRPRSVGSVDNPVVVEEAEANSGSTRGSRGGRPHFRSHQRARGFYTVGRSRSNGYGGRRPF